MPRCHTWIIIAVAPALASTVLAVDVVFDPTNFQVNLEQVAHHLEEIARFDEQIRNQLRMLENWEFTRLDQLLAAMEQVRGNLEGVMGVDLPSLYPIAGEAYATRTAEVMEDLREQWLESHRAAVVQARSVQDGIVAAMPGTRERVGEYLQHSGDAAGQTAVLQASNETVATLAAQLQDLQALELAETRVELELQARSQAEAAFYRQRRTRLLQDWSSGSSHESKPIQSPFGGR